MMLRLTAAICRGLFFCGICIPHCGTQIDTKSMRSMVKEGFLLCCRAPAGQDEAKRVAVRP